MKKVLLLFAAFTLLFVVKINVKAQNYIGSSTCIACHTATHPTIVEEYQKSGHPYKLNEVNGAPPIYPTNTSPGVPNTPPNTTWNDFAYVIGGYGWKARFVKTDGRIFTADSSAQYNLENQTWVPYHFGEDKKYDYACFTCHTTGPSAEGSWNGTPSDSLGTFSEPGVRCEGCHGPGSDHMANTGTPPPITGENLRITRCGECHQRGGATNLIPASSGYIKHHEQINEMRASRHGDGVGTDLTCATCHNAHIPLRYPNAAGTGLSGIGMECESCHPNHEIQLNGSPKAIECVDCHMPPASKSAVGMVVGNGRRGDVSTHIMGINTAAVDYTTMFNTAGDLVELDVNGLAAVTLDFICLRCHTTEDLTWASNYAVDIHTNGLTAVGDNNNTVPVEYSLDQNYPNPFNPTTTIKFALPSASQVKLSVYDITGQLMGILVDDMMPSGNHSLEFNAETLPSGVYVYALEAGNFSDSKKMLLLK